MFGQRNYREIDGKRDKTRLDAQHVGPNLQPGFLTVKVGWLAWSLVQSGDDKEI
jgi:hypothetical protein